MTKIQLTLTDQEVDILSTKAARLGYNVTRFIKFIISQETAKSFDPHDNLPTFSMSEKQEQVGLQALKDFKAGKTTNFNSIDELLDE